jgi:hypothetical protein
MRPSAPGGHQQKFEPLVPACRPVDPFPAEGRWVVAMAFWQWSFEVIFEPGRSSGFICAPMVCGPPGAALGF